MKDKTPLTQSVGILVLALALVGACANDIKGDPGTSAAVRKPVYNQPTLNTTQVIIPASEQQPSKAVIEGTTYTNSSILVCDLTQNGRNGLDDGDIEGGKIYYLYAIPSESETEFDSVASTKGPELGPAGFPTWSYLGAFRVAPDKTVSPFTNIGDGILYHAPVLMVVSTVTYSSYVQIIPNAATVGNAFGEAVPSTATVLEVEAYVSANPTGTPVESGYYVFSTNGQTSFHDAAAWSDTAVGTQMRSIETFLLPLSTDNSFYYKIYGPPGTETRLNYLIWLNGFLEFPQLWP